jgi:hypothetical protein
MVINLNILFLFSDLSHGDNLNLSQSKVLTMFPEPLYI